MCVARILRSSRVLLALGVLVFPALVVGCGEGSGGSSATATPEEIKAQTEKERAAREAAYGKGGNPKPPGADHKSGAGRNSSKG